MEIRKRDGRFQIMNLHGCFFFLQTIQLFLGVITQNKLNIKDYIFLKINKFILFKHLLTIV